MEATEFVILTISVFVVASLFSSVGHGGGSGYLAVMGLVGLAPESMKSAALLLNIIVAGIAAFSFIRAGYFRWRSYWPFASTSIPFAFVGGTLLPDAGLYYLLVGILLVIAAFRIAHTSSRPEPEYLRPIPIYAALPAGAGIGFSSGIIGIGGGVLFSPLLLFMKSEKTLTVSGIAACFVLANSAAAFSGHLVQGAAFPPSFIILALAAVSGGWIGASSGSRRLSPGQARLILAGILLIAGFKLILTLH